MLSFCCRRHQPNRKGSSSHCNKANWKRSFKFMILILNWCNLQFFHNGRFETIIFVYNCKVEGLNVPACNFFSVQCVLIGVRFAVKWTTLKKHICKGNVSTMFYYIKTIPKGNASSFWTWESLMGHSASKIQELGYPSEASVLHPESGVPHLCNIFWIGSTFLMGTKTLPSFSALLVWFFLFLHCFPQKLLLGGY